jgi:hypothetical protein
LPLFLFQCAENFWHLGPNRTVKCRSCTRDNASPRITRREIEIFRITGLVLTASIVVSIIALSARRLVNMAYDLLRGGCRRRRTESCFRGRLLRGIQLLCMRSSRMGSFCIESALTERMCPRALNFCVDSRGNMEDDTNVHFIIVSTRE